MPTSEPATREYTTMNRGHHSLHECRTADEFRSRFEATIGHSLEQVVDKVVASSAPRAVFAAGSIVLGMGSSGSDVDLIVLVDDKSALVNDAGHSANNARALEFCSDSELIAGEFLTMYEGVLVDLNVAIAPAIHRLYARLRRRGPELSEAEVRVLGRLSSGWLLAQTAGYMDRHGAILKDPALAVYCATVHFVSSLHEVSKAARAVDSRDAALALYHARKSVEGAYLAYFATEGLLYLGSKWLAQLGYARGAAERMERHPLLKQGIPLLFPQYTPDSREVAPYLKAAAEFVAAMRGLIEQKTLFRIAFNACPQMHPL